MCKSSRPAKYEMMAEEIKQICIAREWELVTGHLQQCEIMT